MDSSKTQPIWFDVGATQELVPCKDSDILDANAMLHARDGVPVRASHLHLDTSPTTSQYIQIQFKRPQISEPLEPTAPSRRWIALAALLAAAMLIALLA